MRLIRVMFILLCLLPSLIYGQESKVTVNGEGKSITMMRHAWTAQWITHPSESTLDYGVFNFRKTFDLESVPAEYIIHISADNKYRLYVNGDYVTFGPSRGDINNWRYATLDIAKYLKVGKNVVASEVVNFGEYRHGAQQTFQTAFILQDEVEGESSINTGKKSGWKVSKNMGYNDIPFVSDSVGGYYAAGPGDLIDANFYNWGWEQIDYDDSNWDLGRNATVEFAVGRGFLYGSTWFLVPRTIPFMEEKRIDFKYIIQQENIELSKTISASTFPITIPANSKVTFVFDNIDHAVGYPKLTMSKGKDARLKLTYAEAQFLKASTTRSAHSGWKKGHRLELEGQEVRGYYDTYIGDGGKDRVFQPLGMRTFRFVEFDIVTGNQPLVIEDYHNVYTAYPFKAMAKFESNDTKLKEIWDASWRTLKNSSHDVFMDPYYEQLQYVGDARVTSLAALYMTGDDKLMKKAIRCFDDSRLPIGLTQSRFPSYIVQVIPTYSLFWVSMMHDFHMYRDEPEFLKQFLPGVETVMKYFIDRLDETGMPSDMDWWNFTDWTIGFPNGVPPGNDDDHSANISLQLVKALQDAAELFEYFGKHEQSIKYATHAANISKSVMNQCYNSSRNMIAEQPDKQVFSQHTNIFAILTDAVPKEDQKALMRNILNEKDMIQVSIYYRYYLFRALQKSGLGNEYQELLEPWEFMLDQGMTTFGEMDRNPRSECHAWSSTPSFDFNHTIAGIYPSSPGFNDVIIEPNMGDLNYIKGAIPHPKGLIEYEYKRTNSKLKGYINLPKGVTGTLKYNGQEFDVSDGGYSIKVKL